MILSDISVRRPVFATVMSLLLVVLGLAAVMRMPVREYPDIDPPIVSITTTYKGASAPVIESQITEILEAAVAGIEGVKLMSSASRDERSSITLEFHVGRDVDVAANDVRDKVSRSLRRLPDNADQPVVAKVDGDARAILWISLVSDRYSGLQLTDIAKSYFVDRLAIVDGVAQVNIQGERRFAMRIWLDRKAMAARGLTAEDIATAIRRENVELPGGRLESDAREFTVRTDTRMSTPEEFRDLVVLRRDGTQVTLGEVARVEIGPEDDRGEYRIAGKNSIGVGILRQSTANTLSVADGVKAEVARIQPTLPEGIDIVFGYDESLFISQSIYEVFHALMIALLLVVGVIFAFLRSFRATIIPAMAIPVSIIASFIAMGAMGFSLNVLTLLGMVLAIGIVVDDAIVVLENIHRRIEKGEPPLLASLRGAREIAFAVIATTLVLVAVFVPISFMGGNTGRLFSEFGFALAASVAFSGFVALSLTPMMCSKLLKPHSGESRLIRYTEPVFTGMNEGLRWALHRTQSAPFLVLAVAGAIAGLAVVLFIALPKEFAPVEDRGVVIVPVTAPEGSTFAYTREHVLKIEEIFRPYIERGDATVVSASIGGWGRPAVGNTANVFLRLSPWNERSVRQQEIVREVFPVLMRIPGVRAPAINPASLGQRGISQPVQFVLQGPDYDTLAHWRDLIMERMRDNPRLLNPDTNYRETKPELRVEIDRRRAADMGVSVEAVGKTLEIMLGSVEVGSYVERGEEYKVILQARPEDRITPGDLSNIFVRVSQTGAGTGGPTSSNVALVPLSNLINMQEIARPQTLYREDRIRAVTITASLADGYPLGEALDYMDAIAHEVLPATARTTYRGMSLEFREASSALYLTFAMALLVVFLVLAAQFESFIHPLIILLSTPLALTGGLLALSFQGMTLNVYSQIGMILLIGLMAKNGILVVEFANQLRDRGMSVADAVIEASVVRLRPILMTSIATILGALPLAMGYGAGAEARQALGVVIMGGIGFSTIVTLFAIPALYLLLAPFTQPVNTIARRLTEMESRPAVPRHAHPAE